MKIGLIFFRLFIINLLLKMIIENDSGEDVSVDYVDSEDEVKTVIKPIKKQVVEKKPIRVPKKMATNIKKNKVEIKKENDNYLGCEVELTTEEYFK